MEVPEAYKKTFKITKNPAASHLKQKVPESIVRKKSIMKKVKAFVTKSLTSKSSINYNKVQEKENGNSQTSTVKVKYKPHSIEEDSLSDTISLSFGPHEYLENIEIQQSDLSFVTDSTWCTEKKIPSQKPLRSCANTSKFSIATWKSKAGVSLERKCSENKETRLENHCSFDLESVIKDNVKKKFIEESYSSDEVPKNIIENTSQHQMKMHRSQLNRDTISLIAIMNGDTLTSTLSNQLQANEQKNLTNTSKRKTPSKKSLLNRILTKMGIPSRAKLNSEETVVKCFDEDSAVDLRNESEITLKPDNESELQVITNKRVGLSSSTFFPESSTISVSNTVAGRTSVASTYNYKGLKDNLNSSTEADTVKPNFYTINCCYRNRNYNNARNQRRKRATQTAVYNEDCMVYYVVSLNKNANSRNKCSNGNKKSVIIENYLNDKHNIEPLLNNLLKDIDSSQVSSILVMVPSSDDTETELSTSVTTTTTDSYYSDASTTTSQTTPCNRPTKQKFKPLLAFNKNIPKRIDDYTNLAKPIDDYRGKNIIDTNEQQSRSNFKAMVRECYMDLSNKIPEDTPYFVSENDSQPSITFIRKPLTLKMPEVTITDRPSRDKYLFYLESSSKDSEKSRPKTQWEQLIRHKINDNSEVKEKALKRNILESNNYPAEFENFINEHHPHRLHSCHSDSFLLIRSYHHLSQNPIIKPILASNQRQKREMDTMQLKNKRKSTGYQVVENINTGNTINGHGKRVHRKTNRNTRSIGCGGKVNTNDATEEDTNAIISTLTQALQKVIVKPGPSSPRKLRTKARLIKFESCTSTHKEEINVNPAHKGTQKLPHKEIHIEDFSKHCQSIPQNEIPRNHTFAKNNGPSLLNCLETRQEMSIPEVRLPQSYNQNREESNCSTKNPRMHVSIQLPNVLPERDSPQITEKNRKNKQICITSKKPCSKLDVITVSYDKPSMCVAVKQQVEDFMIVAEVSDVTVVPSKNIKGNSPGIESFNVLKDKNENKNAASYQNRECKFCKEKAKTRRNHRNKIDEITEEVIYQYLQNCEEKLIRSILYRTANIENSSQLFTKTLNTRREYPKDLMKEYCRNPLYSSRSDTLLPYMYVINSDISQKRDTPSMKTSTPYPLNYHCKSSLYDSEHSLPKRSPSLSKQFSKSSKILSRQITSKNYITQRLAHKISPNSTQNSITSTISSKLDIIQPMLFKQNSPKVIKSISTSLLKCNEMCEANFNMERSCQCNPDILKRKILEALRKEKQMNSTAKHYALEKHIVSVTDDDKMLKKRAQSLKANGKGKFKSSSVMSDRKTLVDMAGATYILKKIRETKNKLIQISSTSEWWRKKPRPKIEVATDTADKSCMCFDKKKKKVNSIVVSEVMTFLPRGNSKGLYNNNENKDSVPCCKDPECQCKAKILKPKSILVEELSDEIMYDYLPKYEEKQIRSILYRDDCIDGSDQYSDKKKDAKIGLENRDYPKEIYKCGSSALHLNVHKHEKQELKDCLKITPKKHTKSCQKSVFKLEKTTSVIKKFCKI